MFFNCRMTLLSFTLTVSTLLISSVKTDISDFINNTKKYEFFTSDGYVEYELIRSKFTLIYK